MVENAGDPDEPPDELLELLRSLEPAVVVVGIPRHMDGSEGEMAEEARAFGRRIAETADLEVVEWDERLSTEGARRAMIEGGASRRKRRERGAADRVAAAILLKAYLASGGIGAGGG